MRAHEKRSASPFDDAEDEDGSCTEFPGMDRKRRRGIIEKRRRDRINYNLSELRRLVPDAAQKQASTKLEKAEILQMTVEFLKRIHKDGTVLNSEMRLLENRLLGFQECFAEVTRFLSTLPETSSVDEMFRKKLLSHLHACIYRRDHWARTHLASISAIASNGGSGPLQSTTSFTTAEANPPIPWQQEGQGTFNEPQQGPSYWSCYAKSGEIPWTQSDFQTCAQTSQKSMVSTTSAVNESQSTNSPSMLGNFEETDSGNSTVNRYSPGERDVSTDVHSMQTYSYDTATGMQPAYQTGYEAYGYGYHQHQQAYTENHAAAAVAAAQPSSCYEQTREISYYHDDF